MLVCFSSTDDRTKVNQRPLAEKDTKFVDVRKTPGKPQINVCVIKNNRFTDYECKNMCKNPNLEKYWRIVNFDIWLQCH